jgi:hypothetical protein
MYRVSDAPHDMDGEIITDNGTRWAATLRTAADRTGAGGTSKSALHVSTFVFRSSPRGIYSLGLNVYI